MENLTVVDLITKGLSVTEQSENFSSTSYRVI